MPGHSYGRDKVKVFTIKPDAEGVFIERINRFLAIVKIGSEEYVHVHDPGRLEELLYPGNRVLLKREEGKNRKTRWDLIAAWYEKYYVFLNSKYHRPISEKILRSLFPEDNVKAEVSVGHSRLDFLVGTTYVEVKGCTLEIAGKALFPDAPTERGRRHVDILKNTVRSGGSALLLVLIFHPHAKCFAPYEERDAKFADAFYSAIRAGVGIRMVRLGYDGASVNYYGEIGLCNH